MRMGAVIPFVSLPSVTRPRTQQALLPDWKVNPRSQTASVWLYSQPTDT
jgi:hypothetical protein